jgi:hypothetical protein
MAFRFFQVPVRESGVAEEELNRFLRSHRVLSVDRRWVDQGTESFWSFCVDYLETVQPSTSHSRPGGGDGRGKVDYREVLSPEQFAAFVKLRELRQTISKDEAVPVYVIFTNEQLAAMVQQGAASKADLGRIDGVGEARIQRYGERFLECLKTQRDRAHEAGRPVDGTGAEAHLPPACRPPAVIGVVENGLVRPLDSAVRRPEHSRVILIAAEGGTAGGREAVQASGGNSIS